MISIFLGFDTIFTALVSNISAQLTILRGAFKTIRSRSLRNLGLAKVDVLRDPPELDKEMQKEMKKCARHLQVVFE